MIYRIYKANRYITHIQLRQAKIKTKHKLHDVLLFVSRLNS